LGEFHTTLTSTVPEENIKVTAAVAFTPSGGEEQKRTSSSKTITFTPLGDEVADLTDWRWSIG